MIEVTELAQTKLREYMEQNNLTSPLLRVALVSMGCAGSSLSLVIDEKKDTDDVSEYGDLTVLIEKDLLEKCGSVTVDYLESGSQAGFTINSANPVGGGGCASCSSCGG